MAHSYAQQATLNCPNCGHSFSPDIWFIVDGAERPDLLVRVREGTIHHFVCPNGHIVAKNVPLLLLRLEEARPLLFSPEEQFTLGDNQEIADQLLDLLAESLGDSWREEWVESAVVVPRWALAAVLNQAEETGGEVVESDPLLDALKGFIESSTWMESYRFASEHPELLSDAADGRLSWLIEQATAAGEMDAVSTLTEDRILLRRARSHGWAAAFAEAMGTTIEEVMALDAMERAATVIPPATQQMLQELVTTLESQGVSFNTEEELQAALATQPELAARMEAAMVEAEEAFYEAVGPGPQMGELRAFIEAPTLLESYRFARGHPELLNDTTDARLVMLTDRAAASGAEGWVKVLTGYRDLLQRARVVGIAQAFAEKMGTTPEIVVALDEVITALAAEGVSFNELELEQVQEALDERPELAARLLAVVDKADDTLDMPPQYQEYIQQAQAAEQLYQTSGDSVVLDGAVAAWECILDDPGFAATSDRFQLAVLSQAGTSFLKRYGAAGHLVDLNRALSLAEDVVAVTPADAPELAGRLSNLGNALMDLYARTGQLVDLERAIAAHEAAANATPIGTLGRATFLNNLSAGLCQRYLRAGRIEDLDQAIVSWEGALVATPADDPHWVTILNNLSGGLRLRYEETRQPEDLARAIAVHQAAMATTPVEARDGSTYLHNLGVKLRDRYMQTRHLDDLEGTIAAHEAAVAATMADAPNRALYLGYLGNALEDLYARTGQLADLDRAIAAHEAAVAATMADAPNRALHLGFLGTALRARYTGTGQLADLDRAITAWEAAAAATPIDAPGHEIHLNNLGSGLRDRYVWTGQPEDLARAITAWESAVATNPSNAMYRNNLGNGLRARYARTRQPYDLKRAIVLHEAAVAATPTDDPDRALYLINLGNGLSTRYMQTERLKDLEEAIAAYEAALSANPVDARDRHMYLTNLATGLSEHYSQTGQLEKLERAIDVLQVAVDATPPNSPDWAGTLSSLSDGLRKRYARTGQPEDLVVATEFARKACLAAADRSDEVALLTARRWSNLALLQAEWGEALQAATTARDTLRRLVEANVLVEEQLSWRREAQGLAAHEAYAWARLGDTVASVLTLETGQASQLNATLGRGRDRVLLEQLHEDVPALFDAYVAAAAVRTAQRLGQSDLMGLGQDGAAPDTGELRRRAAEAQAALDEIVKRIRAQPGYETLFAPVAFDDVAVAVGETPLAYLATTPVGSVVLLLYRAAAGIEVEAHFAEFTSDELNRLLGGRAAATDKPGGGLLLAQVTGIGLAGELAAALPLLGDRLMTPLAARLHALGVTAVTLIPGGLLNLLPLHAATVELNGWRGPFLEAFAVTFAPSVQTVVESQARDRSSGNGGVALVVGNPMPVAAPLRYAREEAEAVAELFPGRAMHLYETDATLDAVRAALPGCDLFHFAGHGTFDPTQPLDSGIVLAGGARLTLRTVRDGEALVGTRLVVLSACQTGLIDFLELPDEVIGLSTGFLVAGASGVVGSLWPVDDRSTGLLMTDFHRRMLDNQPPAEALRAAQLWLRGTTRAELGAYYEAYIRLTAAEAFAAQGAIIGGGPPEETPYAAPYYWAAFTFSGA